MNCWERLKNTGKKYLIVDDYDVEIFDDGKILIDTDDKLPADTILKNVILLT